jgi:HlyD family secretion protein
MNKKQRTWIIGGAAVVLIVASVLLIAGLRAQGSATGSSAAASYQTTTIQRGTLTSSVEGTGTVRSLLSANLNWTTAGQIDQVTAQIGDQVKDGDVLASLIQNTTQNTLESNLITAEQNLAQLTSPEAVANAKLAVTSAQTAVTNAQTALNNTQYWKNDALIQDYYAKFVIAKDTLDKAQAAYDKANVGAYINNAQEAALYQALYNAQQAYDTAKYYYSLYSQKPTQNQLDQAQANLDLAKANLANAQNYLTALTGGQVPVDAGGADLLKLRQAQLSVQSAKDALDALRITAPFDGTITQAEAVPQAMVSSGTQAFRIDDLSRLVIDVNVVEVDINHVKVGQSAAVTFDAVPNKVYTGKVIKTDLSGTTSQSSVNFVVTVQLTDADPLVRSGMSANVTITTNKVDNALLVPSTSIFTDADNQPYVYLVQNGNLVKVPVTLGAVSDSATQISDGTLKEGDTIVLTFATSSSSNGFGLRVGGGLVGGGGNQTRPVSTP